MENPTFLVVEATPNTDNMDDFQRYLAQAPAITERHGGVPVVTYKVESVFDSGEKPGVFAVFSFPSREAIENLLVNDADYQALIPTRDKGFKSIRYFVCNEQI